MSHFALFVELYQLFWICFWHMCTLVCHTCFNIVTIQSYNVLFTDWIDDIDIYTTAILSLHYFVSRCWCCLMFVFECGWEWDGTCWYGMYDMYYVYIYVVYCVNETQFKLGVRTKYRFLDVIAIKILSRLFIYVLKMHFLK